MAKPSVGENKIHDFMLRLKDVEGGNIDFSKHLNNKGVPTFARRELAATIMDAKDAGLACVVLRNYPHNADELGRDELCDRSFNEAAARSRG